MTTMLPAGRRLRRSLLAPVLAPLRVVEALATPHAIDRYLELVHPMLSARELRAQVVEVRRTTADSVTLTLRPTRHWNGFRAGQYVQLSIDIEGVRRTRCFSPSCSQHRADGLLEITVKAHPDGVVSGHLYDTARPGLVVGLSQAGGDFVLAERRPARMLFVSGGSGMTPVLSMLRTLCDEGYRGDIAFLHYADSAADVAQRAEVVTLAGTHENVRVIFAHTGDGQAELGGHFSQHHLDVAAPWHREAETYLCGPPTLMSAVRTLYDELGRGEHLHAEQFTLTTQVAAAAQPGGTLSFARSGASAQNTGATLLEQAEAAGLTPEFGCRMGICFSCTQVKSSGCTRNIRTGETDSDPDNELQLCINVPVGDVRIEI